MRTNCSTPNYWIELKEKEEEDNKRQPMIDGIMEEEQYLSMKTAEDDRLKWIAKRQKQKDAVILHPLAYIL